jgi:hypothetical protein
LNAKRGEIIAGNHGQYGRVPNATGFEVGHCAGRVRKHAREDTLAFAQFFEHRVGQEFFAGPAAWAAKGKLY